MLALCKQNLVSAYAIASRAGHRGRGKGNALSRTHLPHAAPTAGQLRPHSSSRPPCPGPNQSSLADLCRPRSEGFPNHRQPGKPNHHLPHTRCIWCKEIVVTKFPSGLNGAR
jgi:hypothetical protein